MQINNQVLSVFNVKIKRENHVTQLINFHILIHSYLSKSKTYVCDACYKYSYTLTYSFSKTCVIYYFSGNYLDSNFEG